MSLLSPTIRSAAVAGKFYPGPRVELERLVDRLLQAAPVGARSTPKAIIAPHAGYLFSGPIAASAFRSWAEGNHGGKRVVLLGPSHYVAFRGLALPQCDRFETPLGTIPIDQDAVEKLRRLPQIQEFSGAHAREHCLEVELPFLQRILSDFTIVPLVIGEAPEQEVREVVDLLWGCTETLFVLSSDLSHYHDYETAQQLDRMTASSIEHFESDSLSAPLACGHLALRGFLMAAKPRGFNARTLDLRNSGDTAGPRHSVVGYGAFAFADDLP